MAQEKTQSNKFSDLNHDEKQNLAEFMRLLIKIDHRVNPHLYEDNKRRNNSDKT